MWQHLGCMCVYSGHVCFSVEYLHRRVSVVGSCVSAMGVFFCMSVYSHVSAVGTYVCQHAVHVCVGVVYI